MTGHRSAFEFDEPNLAAVFGPSQAGASLETKLPYSVPVLPSTYLLTTGTVSTRHGIY